MTSENDELQSSMGEGERRSYSAPALEKGLDILEILCRSERPMTQKEISGWEGMTLAAELIYPSLSNISQPPSCVTNLVKSGKTGIAKGAGFKDWPTHEATLMKQKYEQRLKAAFEVLKIAPDQD